MTVGHAYAPRAPGTVDVAPVSPIDWSGVNVLDPVTVPMLTAAISALVGGAAGQAGKSAWDSLTALVRRTFGADDQPADQVLAALHEVERRPEDAAAAAEILAGVLVDRARVDPAFAEALRSWTGQVTVVSETHDVSNVVSGRVEGSVVQARDVSGSINLGDPRPG